MGGRGSGSGMSGGGASYTQQDYVDSVVKWINDMDHVSSKDRAVLESFIEDQVKTNGPVSYTYGISRGVSMSDSELESLQVGGEFTEGKLASWTNKIGIAQSFARNNKSGSKSNLVVIRTKEPSGQAAKLSKASSYKKRFEEGEVLMSSKAKFKIEKIKKSGNYTEVWVKPK